LADGLCLGDIGQEFLLECVSHNAEFKPCAGLKSARIWPLHSPGSGDRGVTKTGWPLRSRLSTAGSSRRVTPAWRPATPNAGESPGLWIGSGIDGIDRVAAGDPVTADHCAASVLCPLACRSRCRVNIEPLSERLGRAATASTADAVAHRADNVARHQPRPPKRCRAPWRNTYRQHASPLHQAVHIPTRLAGIWIVTATAWAANKEVSLRSRHGAIRHEGPV
jgi:hypothetical protein